MAKGSGAINEAQVIARLREIFASPDPRIEVGIGDDAAVVAGLASGVIDNLARMAAAKQTRNLANPTAASKKSSIVREAMRDAKKRDEEKKEEKKVSKSGKDKFQPDPELNSQIIRTE
jgi:hypothetical protein